jgi:hypothetical protein
MIARSSGKIGDLIYGLPCAMARGCHTLYLQPGEWGDPRSVYDRLRPLLPDWQIQPTASPLSAGPELVDLDAFRRSSRLFQQHFTWSHAEMTRTCYGDAYDEPWLRIEPEHAHKAIVSRGFNTRGIFPLSVLQDISDVGFVGTKAEYRDFCDRFPLVHPKFVDAINLRELAAVIAGSEVFIGNPSAPLALAEAMGHPRIYIERGTTADGIFKGRGINV